MPEPLTMLREEVGCPETARHADAAGAAVADEIIA